MHTNPLFRKTPEDTNRAFALEQGFGTLAIAHEGAPLLSHVPFLAVEDGAALELHLTRSNPIARALKSPHPATLAVIGPHGYISPDWYDMADQVPTWNYVAVHITGTLTRLAPEALPAHLDRLSERFEATLAPKEPWRTSKMPDDLMEKMLRQIVPVRLEIAQIDGTWKLNQNKPDAARLKAADHVAAYGIGQETTLLANLMRGAGGETA